MNAVITIGNRSRKLTARGARVRERVVAVTAEMLGRVGYGGTTLEKVSTEGDISRGSILHQFPTRLDIMVATTDHICTHMMAEFRNLLEQIDDPWERIRSYPEAMWKMSRMPLALSLMEVQLAARWDDGLAEGISETVIRFRHDVHDLLAAHLKCVGIEQAADFSARVQAMGSAHQGFALELNIADRSSYVPAAREKLRRDFIAQVEQFRLDQATESMETGNTRKLRG